MDAPSRNTQTNVVSFKCAVHDGSKFELRVRFLKSVFTQRPGERRMSDGRDTPSLEVGTLSTSPAGGGTCADHTSSSSSSLSFASLPLSPLPNRVNAGRGGRMEGAASSGQGRLSGKPGIPPRANSREEMLCMLDGFAFILPRVLNIFSSGKACGSEPATTRILACL